MTAARPGTTSSPSPPRTSTRRATPESEQPYERVATFSTSLRRFNWSVYIQCRVPSQESAHASDHFHIYNLAVDNCSLLRFRPNNGCESVLHLLALGG